MDKATTKVTLNESPTSLQIQLTKSFFFFRGLTFRSAHREVGDLVVHLSAPVLAVTAHNHKVHTKRYI